MNPFHWPEFLFGCAIGALTATATICTVCVVAYRRSEQMKAKLLAQAANSLGSTNAPHPN